MPALLKAALRSSRALISPYLSVLAPLSTTRDSSCRRELLDLSRRPTARPPPPTTAQASPIPALFLPPACRPPLPRFFFFVPAPAAAVAAPRDSCLPSSNRSLTRPPIPVQRRRRAHLPRQGPAAPRAAAAPACTSCRPTPERIARQARRSLQAPRYRLISVPPRPMSHVIASPSYPHLR